MAKKTKLSSTDDDQERMEQGDDQPSTSGGAASNPQGAAQEPEVQIPLPDHLLSLGATAMPIRSVFMLKTLKKRTLTKLSAPEWRWSESTFTDLHPELPLDLVELLGTPHILLRCWEYVTLPATASVQPMWYPERLAARLMAEPDVRGAVRRITRAQVEADAELMRMRCEAEHRRQRSVLEPMYLPPDDGLEMRMLTQEERLAACMRVTTGSALLPQVVLNRPDRLASETEKRKEPFFVTPELLPLRPEDLADQAVALERARRATAASGPSTSGAAATSTEAASSSASAQAASAGRSDTSELVPQPEKKQQQQPPVAETAFVVPEPISADDRSLLATLTKLFRDNCKFCSWCLTGCKSQHKSSTATTTTPLRYTCLYPGCGLTFDTQAEAWTHVGTKHYLVNDLPGQGLYSYADWLPEHLREPKERPWCPLPFPHVSYYVHEHAEVPERAKPKQQQKQQEQQLQKQQSQSPADSGSKPSGPRRGRSASTASKDDVSSGSYSTAL